MVCYEKVAASPAYFFKAGERSFGVQNTSVAAFRPTVCTTSICSADSLRSPWSRQHCQGQFYTDELLRIVLLVGNRMPPPPGLPIQGGLRLWKGISKASWYHNFSSAWYLLPVFLCPLWLRLSTVKLFRTLLIKAVLKAEDYGANKVYEGNLSKQKSTTLNRPRSRCLLFKREIFMKLSGNSGYTLNSFTLLRNEAIWPLEQQSVESGSCGLLGLCPGVDQSI